MAVGDTSGEPRPKRVVTAGGGKRSAALGEIGADGGLEAGAEAIVEEKPLVSEADPDLERILAEEEDINRRLREHHEAPHFHKDAD